MKRSYLLESLRKNRRALVQGSAIALISLLASSMIGASVFGRLISEITLDQYIRDIRARHPKPAPEVVLVDITEEDYDSDFHRQRPLNPKIIIDLIRAAHEGGAKLVGVDISTEDWPANWREAGDLPADTAIVWARDFYLKPNGKHGEYIPARLLGGAPNIERECSGFPALGEQAGVVRWVYDRLTLNGKAEPSFMSQVKYRKQHMACLPEAGDDERPFIIDFSYVPRHETASTLLSQAEEAGWRPRQEFKDAVVILGGSFHAGADLRETPVGVLSGLQVNGLALATLLLAERPSRELTERQGLLIDVALATFLIACGIFGRMAQLGATVAALGFTVWLSLHLFKQSLFLSFLPIAFGVLVHLWLERRWHNPTAHPDSINGASALR